MKGVCINDDQCNVIVKGETYFLFPNGPSNFYVSKFDNSKAHSGCFNAKRFRILEEPETASDQAEIAENNQERELQYSQMDLFDLLDDERDNHTDQEAVQVIEVMVPPEIISPLESSKGVKTKAFKDQQRQWSSYVRRIQEFHKCSWMEARSLLIEYRDQQKPIKMIVD